MTVAVDQLRDLRANRHGGHLLGRLLTPRHPNRLDETIAAGIPWAADCDGFGDFHEGRYLAMLSMIGGRGGALFVVAPDVFGDHEATLEAWHRWHPRIRAAGHPPAFVLQPGVELDTVPWDTVGALFLGGPDEHRARPAVRAIIAEARRRGLHVHVGRVNGPRRARDAYHLGACSIDGSGLARWRDATLPPVLATVANLVAHPQAELDL